jgi:hypothetical protein
MIKEWQVETPAKKEGIDLKLFKTKTFSCGVIILYYSPAKNVDFGFM